MPNAQRHLEYLIARQVELAEELGRYVSIESGSREKAGVDRVGQALAPAFEELGFTVERIVETECGDHLVARRSGSGEGRLLALIHLDTLWPSGGLADNPFRIEDGIAYGPGIRDMKGGWVVLLAALRALDAAGWDGLAETTVFMTADEQLGSPRGRRWIEQEADSADWALVLEPAREGGALVTSRGVVGSLAFDIAGISAHSIERGLGVNANLEAAHKIQALEALSDDERGVIVSVGLVQGGTSRQYTAARAWLSVDLRAPDNMTAEQTLARMRQIADTASVPGTHTTMSGGLTRPAFPTSPGAERLLRVAQSRGPAVGIPNLQATYSRGGSDGSFTAAMGVPTLDGLGIEGGGGFGQQENALVASIPRRGALLAGIIEGLPELLSE
jgi:glutamate carboxypeptidase